MSTSEKVSGRLRAKLERANTIVATAWARGTAQPWFRPRLLADIGLLGVLTIIHSIFGRSFLYAATKFDEQFFLFEGFSLGKGLVPYRDFQELKPPAIFVVNMLALKIFGLDGMRYRHFFALLTLAAYLSVAIALLSRRVPRLLILILVALMISHSYDRGLIEGSIDTVETFGLDFFLLAVGTLLLKTRWVEAQQIAGGVLLALAPLTKEPFVIPTLVAWLSLLALYQTEAGAPRAWWLFARRTATGALALGLVWLIYMLVTRSLGSYLTQLKQILTYSADHNVMYGVFPKLSFAGTLAEFWRRLAKKYVNAPHLVLFVPFFLSALLLWRRRGLLLAASVLATFLAGLYGVTIGRGFFGHYFLIAMTGTFYWATLGAIALGERFPEVAAPWRRWVVATLALLVLSSLGPRLEQDWDAWGSARPQPQPVPEAVVRVVKARTAPNDRIWNIGTPILYVVSDRLNGSSIPFMHDSILHLYAGATDAERLAPYRRELDRTLPKLVLMSTTGAACACDRYMRGLVLPFLHDHKYREVRDPAIPTIALYERPN